MQAVRRIRKGQGWSQERTAAEAGIDRVTLVHIETGRSSPTVETLQKLAGALGVEIADFFPRAQSALFASNDSPAGQDATTLADSAARALADWTESLSSRGEEARFRWRRGAAEVERTQDLASALTLDGEVRAAVRGFFQEIMALMLAWDREVAREAPGRKAELASLATDLKEASDAVRSGTQALIGELEARRRVDEEEIREFVAREFGVDLEEHRVEADETDADVYRIEELRARRAG
ncbi:MAG TPA: helix-turn-helix transcriptional regulator [Rubrobacter sp.]|nr:helix-turn-helix transcriptional regulator [Rubrobacter sp.]